MRRSSAGAEAPLAVPARVDLDAKVACPQCGLAAVWGALVRTEMLAGAALASHLAVPADGWFVDVRACSRCGRALARKMRTTS